MIKRILVALDPDADTPVATRYAAELARRFGAEVTGLAVVDTQRIAAEVGPGGAVGAGYYAEQSRQRMTDDARLVAQRLVRRFDALLDAAAVPHAEHVAEGVPVRQVIDEAKYHDLLVIGRTPHFFYARPTQQTDTLTQVVKKSVAPALVVGDVHRTVGRVLVAFDGSAAAARAMQQFAQLQPFGTAPAVELVHVCKGGGRRERAGSELMLRRAGALLRAHGFARVAETSHTGDRPADQLLAHARHVDADLIVAGAHAVSAMRRLAFGSTTHGLLRDCPVPFFLSP